MMTPGFSDFSTVNPEEPGDISWFLLSTLWCGQICSKVRKCTTYNGIREENPRYLGILRQKSSRTMGVNKLNVEYTYNLCFTII
jgi:hypothetical protein